MWSNRKSGLLNRRSLLVLDAFRCHRMSSIAEELRAQNTDIAIISEGMTKLLQPLGVSMNKPMKDALLPNMET